MGNHRGDACVNSVFLDSVLVSWLSERHSAATRPFNTVLVQQYGQTTPWLIGGFFSFADRRAASGQAFENEHFTCGAKRPQISRSGAVAAGSVGSCCSVF